MSSIHGSLTSQRKLTHSLIVPIQNKTNFGSSCEVSDLGILRLFQYLPEVWKMVEADVTQSDLDPELKAALDTIVEELVDEVSLGLCFEIHRSCKVGSLFLNGCDDTSDMEYALIDRPGVDVLGQVPSKKNYECVCPNCQRHLAASRFAPHLEKCMGMGRNSSRIASRRIANNQKQGGSDESGQEDENDNDWNYAPESKKLKRLKKDKMTSSPRNRRLGKLRNGGSSQDLPSLATEQNDPDSAPYYESMTIEERKALLLTSCGVISEHTKRMCTRTGKCVQHTEEQRRQVRQQLLRQSRAHELEDIHIDIDTYDDAESQSLRESLQWEASSNSSPADSTSTNNSTSGIPASSSTAPTASVSSSSQQQGSAAAAAGSKRPGKSSGGGGAKSGKSKKAKMSSSSKQSVSSSSSASSSNKDVSTANLYDFC